MGIIKRRILGYFFLSMGIALALGPYDLVANKRYEGPGLVLSALATDQKSLKLVCPEGIKQIEPTLLEGFVTLNKAWQKLNLGWPEETKVYLQTPEIQTLGNKLGIAKKKAFCFKCQKRIYRLVPVPFLKNRGDLYLVGAEPGEMGEPVAPGQGVTQNQTWQTYLEKITKPNLPHKEYRYMPAEYPDPAARPTWVFIEPQTWRDISPRLKGDNAPLIRLDGFVIKSWIKPVYESYTQKLDWLMWLRLVLAACFLAFGWRFISGCYGKKPGISINPSWVGVFTDTMFILFTAAGAYAILAYYQKEYLAVTPILDDQAVLVVMSAMYVPVLIFLAFYASNLAGQSLEVTRSGLVRHGPGKSINMPWEKIRGFSLRETQIPLVRGGVALPRKLQTKLVIELDNDQVEVFEPANKSIKLNILLTIAEKGPDRLEPDLKKISEKW
ncbi:hypothetical protein [Dethiosulfatarculus sandiegensis]|uniref:Uncharacterized protein n=1 Tax=Dethiosulfatarculus sandiegensis TaxID=1429043 RepID=A0A0D2J766_9BACT|nr:hypothetical protein [Dethiosulfatarculus sandiegensis]KIX14019.1 hypothetical protein X474_13220 [Dethiosulfatarculus sandiegensis]